LNNFLSGNSGHKVQPRRVGQTGVFYGQEIGKTDQGSQFTAEEFTMAVLKQGCKLSMDGKGAWRDNVFVERLWRSVKYERVYLMAYDSVGAARTCIAQYQDWYNTERPHSSLGRTTPDSVYQEMQPKLAEAA
jgi:putative transposase